MAQSVVIPTVEIERLIELVDEAFYAYSDIRVGTTQITTKFIPGRVYTRLGFEIQTVIAGAYLRVRSYITGFAELPDFTPYRLEQIQNKAPGPEDEVHVCYVTLPRAFFPVLSRVPYEDIYQEEDTEYLERETGDEYIETEFSEAIELESDDDSGNDDALVTAVQTIARPYSWYRLDDLSTGSVMSDSSGNGNDGSYMATAESGTAISNALKSYKPQGQTNLGGFTLPGTLWTQGASETNGWIVSVFLAKAASVTAGTTARFLWGSVATNGTGITSGAFIQDGLMVYNPSGTVTAYASLPRQDAVVTDEEVHMYSLAYRPSATGRTQYQAYLDGVAVTTYSSDSTVTPIAATADIRGGSPNINGTVYGNDFRMAELISIPGYSSDSEEASALLQLYYMLKLS